MDSTSNKKVVVVAVVAVVVLTVGTGVLLLLRRENESLRLLNQQLDQNEKDNLKNLGTGTLAMGGATSVLGIISLIF